MLIESVSEVRHFVWTFGFAVMTREKGLVS